jgi:hypothetical protein
MYIYIYIYMDLAFQQLFLFLRQLRRVHYVLSLLLR